MFFNTQYFTQLSEQDLQKTFFRSLPPKEPFCRACKASEVLMAQVIFDSLLSKLKWLHRQKSIQIRTD